MKLLGKYFFSAKIDFLAFCSFIPIYFLFTFIDKTQVIQLPKNPPFLYMLWGWIIVDGSHVYSSLLVTYTDKDMVRQLRPYLWGIPIAIMAAAFTLSFTGQSQYFYYFLAYVAMIHFIRQEFGWMKIASKLDSQAPKWLFYTDVGTSYAMTILPLLWTIRETVVAQWYRPGDVLGVPLFVAEWALKLFWPIVSIFLAANAYQTYKTKTFNLSKMLVFLNTLFGWYIAKTFIQNPYMAGWFFIFHHGIPYYFIVFKTERVSSNVGWLQALGKFKFPVMYLGCVIIFYCFLMGHSGNSFIASLKKDPFLFSLVYCISVMPQMTHFILDGMIWKKKYGLVGGVGKNPGTLPSTRAEAA